ncbi:MAG: hypothetical protein V4857_27850 [Pseudomonadota bacterium]
MKALFGALLCASVCACSRTESVAAPAATASAPKLQANVAVVPKEQASTAATMAQLMVALFGRQYRSASGDALAELADSDDRALRSMYVITPVAHTTLPDGSTVLVANAELPDDQGKASSSHASPGLLNVFFLKHDGARWQVLKRHENIDTVGSSGQLGAVSFVALAYDKPGMAITYSWMGQGYLLEGLALFDLSAPAITNLTEGISLHSDNEGACETTTKKCWSVDGKWRMVKAKTPGSYDDLVVEFSGHTAVPSPAAQTLTREQLEALDNIERVKTGVQATARYAFDGKAYQLAEGANIVPEV